MRYIETDVLIVGAGIAGLTTALSAQQRRVSILSWSDRHASDTASDYAQGGIAAAVGPNDTPELHVRDTLAAGHHKNLPAIARLVCNHAASAVQYLESLGVSFALDAAEGYALHTEAAHTQPRVLHVGGDATGAALMSTLRARIEDAKHVERLPRLRAVSLLCDSTAVRGVAALDDHDQAVTVGARAVVIATGGIGGLYSRTTNPGNACGDGLAMALRAGARCARLEFVQFHPTALNVDARPLPLMTEALRGAGARLIDAAGTSIMRSAHPLGDLAPRDVVARAVYAAQRSGREVWLDATHLRGLDLAEAFPSAYRLCCAHGIDPRREPIPVTPAQHYHMGGIAVDLEGRTSLQRLWAVGEAACTGLHGANRLASNSLLESVVFGRRAGTALNHETIRSTAMLAPLAEPSIAPDSLAERQLQEVMWHSMGVIRNARAVGAGLSAIARLCEATPRNSVLQHSRLLLATHMLVAAAKRRVTCGAHYRDDDEVDAAPRSVPEMGEAVGAAR